MIYNTILLYHKYYYNVLFIYIYIYNQGGLINYNDILEALETNKIAGFGLDVFHTEPFPNIESKLEYDPILSHPNVIATPHIAGVTEISYRNMANAVFENVKLLINGEKPIGIVNQID